MPVGYEAVSGEASNSGGGEPSRGVMSGAFRLSFQCCQAACLGCAVVTALLVAVAVCLRPQSLQLQRFPVLGAWLSKDRAAFCGVAVPGELGGDFGEQLSRARKELEGQLWGFNGRASNDLQAHHVEFMPMITRPGDLADLPTAGEDGAGSLVLGWDRPDDAGQAGAYSDGQFTLAERPAAFAQAWVKDMEAAAMNGYSEFGSPVMSHDTCWLDYFLEACESTEGCKELVTYLVFQRHSGNCAAYKADMADEVFRQDLNWVLTFNHLREKYNRRGFTIKGIIWAGMGCDETADQAAILNYMKEFLEGTLVKVLSGDPEVTGMIVDSPTAQWLGPNGPEADPSVPYEAGQCHWHQAHPVEDPDVGADVLRALLSLRRVAWNGGQLFSGGLGEKSSTYISACATLQQIAHDAPVVADECASPKEHDECYEHISWGINTGVVDHPEWYPDLTAASPREDFQNFLYRRGHGDCPRPCSISVV